MEPAIQEFQEICLLCWHLLADLGEGDGDLELWMIFLK